jgi:hypothetical protein
MKDVENMRPDEMPPPPEPIPLNAPPNPGWDAPLPDEPMRAEESKSERITFRDEGV